MRFESGGAVQTQFEILEEEALKLTPGERAALAQRLLANLDEDTEIEEAWAVEVERRIAEVESGAVQPVPIDEALGQVRYAEVKLVQDPLPGPSIRTNNQSLLCGALGRSIKGRAQCIIFRHRTLSVWPVM